MYLIATQAICQQYDKIVVKGENYQPPTISWSSTKKHPTKNLYAIAEHPSYPIENYPEITATVVDELGEDWNEEKA